MSTKIDLDEIHEAGRALIEAIDAVDACRNGDKSSALTALHAMSLAQQAYDRAIGSPRIGVVLVARIRDLEDALTVFGDHGLWEGRIEKVLAKGAVLP